MKNLLLSFNSFDNPLYLAGAAGAVMFFFALEATSIAVKIGNKIRELRGIKIIHRPSVGQTKS